MRAMPVPVVAAFVLMGVLLFVTFALFVGASIKMWRDNRDYPPETPKQRDERRAVMRAEAVERAALQEMLFDNFERELASCPDPSHHHGGSPPARAN